jgi:hypothetical protein
LTRFNAALETLSKLDLATRGAKARLLLCRDAAEAAAKKVEAEQRVKDSFDTLIGNLEQPLNELLATFTPARWAYSTTSLTPSTGSDGARSVGLETTDKARADLRFNTAELNTFATALFLLCATSIDNPLRVLVFDDPFQNMDELTISSVLRGLSRVAPLLPEGWQILILIHGEETLETANRELACATYLLPWLTPQRLREKRIIEPDPLRPRKAGLQPLDNLLVCKAVDSAPKSASDAK